MRNLSQQVTEAVVYEVLGTIGNIETIRVCCDEVTRRLLGHAYVLFTDAHQAKGALGCTDGSSIDDVPCIGEPDLRRPELGKNVDQNIDKGTAVTVLYNSFCKFGGIILCKSEESVELGSDGLIGSAAKTKFTPALQSRRWGVVNTEKMCRAS